MSEAGTGCHNPKGIKRLQIFSHLVVQFMFFISEIIHYIKIAWEKKDCILTETISFFFSSSFLSFVKICKLLVFKHRSISSKHKGDTKIERAFIFHIHWQINWFKPTNILLVGAWLERRYSQPFYPVSKLTRINLLGI